MRRQRCKPHLFCQLCPANSCLLRTSGGGTSCEADLNLNVGSTSSGGELAWPFTQLTTAQLKALETYNFARVSFKECSSSSHSANKTSSGPCKPASDSWEWRLGNCEWALSGLKLICSELASSESNCSTNCLFTPVNSLTFETVIDTNDRSIFTSRVAE